ncbi:MAG: hypothetical protein A2660_01300 [Candidatus Doudnabacteria bacterium RIFCSPHIGHO2_01_FULL_45_18]|uniref:Uncharacterized protein n=1 Tax=Candidatus Doudnabacteria bacterium RIFCSPHIGHO2_01_FULL_45_18 TaxID=1817823 RepID=A0A1F5NS33_9BACT|nr:MAG: hypothetical protein A2660_01300 [Candidatus Doudnabacteria bacterium RIFCSPHIGHO2_01_FULL_45_18]
MNMNKSLLEENKAKLLAEQKRLNAILARDTNVDPEIPGGHKPKFDELGSEEGENAHEVEQFQNDLSVAERLEQRLHKVEQALQRIADGTYGQCIQGDMIDEARMRAEPAADICIQHAK